MDGGWVWALMALLFGFGSIGGDPGLDTSGGDPGSWAGPSSSPVGRQFTKEPRTPDCGMVFEGDLGALDAEVGQPDPWDCLSAQRGAGLGGVVTEISDPSSSGNLSVMTYYVLAPSGQLRVYTETMDTTQGTDDWAVDQCPAPADLAQGCAS